MTRKCPGHSTCLCFWQTVTLRIVRGDPIDSAFNCTANSPLLLSPLSFLSFSCCCEKGINSLFPIVVIVVVTSKDMPRAIDKPLFVSFVVIFVVVRKRQTHTVAFCYLQGPLIP